MELSVREWLILLGVLLIVVVLLDAIRRYRNQRRNTIRLARSTFGAGGGFDDSGVETYSSELPNGGARVVRRSDPPPAAAAPAAARSAAGRQRERVEPRIGELDPPAAGSDPAPADAPADAGAEPAPAEPVAEAPDEVIVIYVSAGPERRFEGPDLLQILLACDVRYGTMNIFHRHEDGHGQGAIQFSVANAVEPGTFDLDGIDRFSTPGISLFLQLPGPRDPLAAYDCMVETARCIVKNLGGQVLDAQRRDLAEAAVERTRQRLQALETSA